MIKKFFNLLFRKNEEIELPKTDDNDNYLSIKEQFGIIDTFYGGYIEIFCGIDFDIRLSKYLYNYNTNERKLNKEYDPNYQPKPPAKCPKKPCVDCLLLKCKYVNYSEEIGLLEYRKFGRKFIFIPDKN